MASFVVAGLLATWFLLELAIQFPFAWCKRLRFLDPTAHLLAAWNFFAPKPIMGDVELFYRHVRRSSETDAPSGRLKSAEWILVQPNGDRCLYHLVVNPHKRARKAIFRCCNYVITHRKRGNLSLSVPYLLLLDRVTMLCPGAGIVQFRIDVIRKDESRVIAYASVPHCVDQSIEDPVQLVAEDAPSGAETGHDFVQPQCV
jgi:hypothetical protein